jgi:hypothetical protein
MDTWAFRQFLQSPVSLNDYQKSSRSNRVAFSSTYVSVQCASQPLNPYFAPFIELRVPLAYCPQ